MDRTAIAPPWALSAGLAAVAGRSVTAMRQTRVLGADDMRIAVETLLLGAVIMLAPIWVTVVLIAILRFLGVE